MNPATCWPDYPGSANAPRNSRCLLVPLGLSIAAHALLLTWKLVPSPAPAPKFLSITLHLEPPAFSEPVLAPALVPAPESMGSESDLGSEPEFDSDPKPHSDPDSDFDHLSLMRTFRERAGADVGEPDSAVARHAAFNSTLRRRLEIAAGLKRNSIQPSEDIVSARARCLVVPQVLQRNTEYDSTITMPDGVCMQQQKVTFLNRETLQ